MIDNVDRMSVNILPFSLDRIVSRLEDQSVDEDLHHLPDQPGSVGHCVVRCVRTNPDFFVSIFSNQITGNEVLISYRKSDGIRLD